MKDETKKLLAKEILANSKLFGLGFALTIIFCIGFYIINKPKYVDEATINSVKAQDNYVRQPAASGSYDLGTTGHRMGALGHSKYDKGVSFQNCEYINEIRKENFNEDIKSKTFYAFIIIIPVLIIGRYLWKLRQWTIRNANL